MNRASVWLLAAAVVPALLSGCGGASEAATVDGVTISDRALQEAATQITEALGGEQTVTAGQLLPMLIAAPTIHEVATKLGKPITDASVRSAFTKGAPSQATVDALRANSELRAMNQKQQQGVAARLGRLSVEVNPRYGTFSPSTLTMKAPAPNWLRAVKVS